MSTIVFVPVRQFVLLYNTELHGNNIGACDEINKQEMAVMDDRLLMKSWKALKNMLDEQDRSKFDRLM